MSESKLRNGKLANAQEWSDLGHARCQRRGLLCALRQRAYSSRVLALNTKPRGRGKGFNKSACAWRIVARRNASAGGTGVRSPLVRRVPTIFTAEGSTKRGR